MAAILANKIFKHISLNENFSIFSQTSLKYVPVGLIDHASALWV